METKVGTAATQDVLPEDIEAIETIHRRDIRATKAGDIDALKSLMDEQCIVFPPDCAPISGQAYLDQVWPSADDEAHADILGPGDSGGIERFYGSAESVVKVRLRQTPAMQGEVADNAHNAEDCG